ncbi:MAG TPA: hypothetical protein DHV84_02075 [Desulfotomaculum sp.]|nr:hypothetical protein [Desulfotomaculum sp.]
MEKIKSAYEKALERAEKITVSPEQLEAMEYAPKGSQAASQYMQDKSFTLEEEFKKYEAKIQKHLKAGAEETFLSNIRLPENEAAKENNKRAFEGILALKRDKKAVNQVFGEMEYLFDYYAKAINQNYQNLKANMNKRLAAAQQALEKQLGTKVKLEVEKQPEFLQEWRKIQFQINAQYENHLKEHKEKIRQIN